MSLEIVALGKMFLRRFSAKRHLGGGWEVGGPELAFFWLYVGIMLALSHCRQMAVDLSPVLLHLLLQAIKEPNA